MRPTGEKRRRYPRIEIDGGHGAQDLTLGHYVRIRDISEGGFQTESPQGATPGDTHVFRVSLRDGADCIVRATAIHSRPVVGASRGAIVGWQAASDAITAAAIQELIDDVTTVDLRPIEGTGVTR